MSVPLSGAAGSACCCPCDAPAHAPEKEPQGFDLLLDALTKSAPTSSSKDDLLGFLDPFQGLQLHRLLADLRKGVEAQKAASTPLTKAPSQKVPAAPSPAVERKASEPVPPRHGSHRLVDRLASRRAAAAKAPVTAARTASKAASTETADAKTDDGDCSGHAM